MALPTLVSSTSPNVGRSSSSTPSNSRPSPESHQPGVHNESGSANLGHMAHLRESYSSRGISSQAIDLLLSSWRSKTNSSYNSQFAKWASRCEQRGRNPAAGPIEDVVNFLADLFQ